MPCFWSQFLQMNPVVVSALQKGEHWETWKWGCFWRFWFYRLLLCLHKTLLEYIIPTTRQKRRSRRTSVGGEWNDSIIYQVYIRQRKKATEFSMNWCNNYIRVITISYIRVLFVQHLHSNHIPCCSCPEPGCSLNFDLKWIIADLPWVHISQVTKNLPVSTPRGVISIKPVCPAFWTSHPGRGK